MENNKTEPSSSDFSNQSENSPSQQQNYNNNNRLYRNNNPKQASFLDKLQLAKCDLSSLFAINLELLTMPPIDNALNDISSSNNMNPNPIYDKRWSKLIKNITSPYAPTHRRIIKDILIKHFGVVIDDTDVNQIIDGYKSMKKIEVLKEGKTQDKIQNTQNDLLKRLKEFHCQPNYRYIKLGNYDIQQKKKTNISKSLEILKNNMDSLEKQSNIGLPEEQLSISQNRSQMKQIGTRVHTSYQPLNSCNRNRSKLEFRSETLSNIPLLQVHKITRRKSCHCSQCGNMSKLERSVQDLPSCIKMHNLKLLAELIYHDETTILGEGQNKLKNSMHTNQIGLKSSFLKRNGSFSKGNKSFLGGSISLNPSLISTKKKPNFLLNSYKTQDKEIKTMRTSKRMNSLIALSDSSNLNSNVPLTSNVPSLTKIDDNEKKPITISSIPFQDDNISSKHHMFEIINELKDEVTPNLNSPKKLMTRKHRRIFTASEVGLNFTLATRDFLLTSEEYQRGKRYNKIDIEEDMDDNQNKDRGKKENKTKEYDKDIKKDDKLEENIPSINQEIRNSNAKNSLNDLNFENEIINDNNNSDITSQSIIDEYSLVIAIPDYNKPESDNRNRQNEKLEKFDNIYKDNTINGSNSSNNNNNRRRHSNKDTKFNKNSSLSKNSNINTNTNTDTNPKFETGDFFITTNTDNNNLNDDEYIDIDKQENIIYNKPLKLISKENLEYKANLKKKLDQENKFMKINVNPNINVDHNIKTIPMMNNANGNIISATTNDTIGNGSNHKMKYSSSHSKIRNLLTKNVNQNDIKPNCISNLSKKYSQTQILIKRKSISPVLKLTTISHAKFNENLETGINGIQSMDKLHLPPNSFGGLENLEFTCRSIHKSPNQIKGSMSPQNLMPTISEKIKQAKRLKKKREKTEIKILQAEKISLTPKQIVGAYIPNQISQIPENFTKGIEIKNTPINSQQKFSIRSSISPSESSKSKNNLIISNIINMDKNIKPNKRKKYNKLSMDSSIPTTLTCPNLPTISQIYTNQPSPMNLKKKPQTSFSSINIALDAKHITPINHSGVSSNGNGDSNGSGISNNSGGYGNGIPKILSHFSQKHYQIMNEFPQSNVMKNTQLINKSPQSKLYLKSNVFIMPRSSIGNAITNHTKKLSIYNNNNNNNFDLLRNRTSLDNIR